MSIESVEVLLGLLGEKRILKSEEEEITMCTALEELKQDWKNEGQNRIIALVSYMIQDGLTDDILRLKSDECFKKEMLEKYHL